jgi:hypothetical protein
LEPGWVSRGSLNFSMRMDEKERRCYQRLLVLSGHAILARMYRNGKRFQGVVSVIGLGGMIIRSRESFSAGTVLQVSFTDPIVSFDSERLVRDCRERGIGLEILSTGPAAQKRLQFLPKKLKL